MKIEDKAYFAVSPAETEKKIRDLTAAWRKLMNVADNLHGMANPSPEIMKRQDQVDADMERIGNQIAELKKSIGVQENVSVRLAKPVEDKAYFDRRIEVETWKSPKGTTYIAGLHQLSGGSFQPFVTATYADGEQQLMTRNMLRFKTEDGARKWLSAEITRRKTPNARQGIKARFDKEWTEAGFSASFFIKKLQGMMAVYQGENDNEYRNKIIGYAKTLANHPDFVLNGVSSQALAKKAFALVKFKYARTGTKSKFANRGAFAEASSSPVLGSLLEKKVMPEGGWRAVETDGAALVIAFEDGDIAGNFARRASENGYSATAPMAMAGRFWNVKVQNENKN